MRQRGQVKQLAVGSRASFEAMNRAIALHQPVVDRIFPFTKVQNAYRHFNERVGKVVIAGQHDGENHDNA